MINEINPHLLTDPKYDFGSYKSIRKRREGFGIRGSKHVITIPKRVTPEVALLAGLIYGDGNLIDYSTGIRTGKWRIEFAERDPLVVREYVRLTQKIFNIRPIIRDRNTWFEAYYANKIVYRFYSRILEHPTGRKTGKLRIPALIKHDTNLLCWFLRGLFTAEGSVFHRNRISILLSMQEPILVREMEHVLSIMGLDVRIYHRRIGKRLIHILSMYGFKQAILFSRQIGFVGGKSIKLSKIIKMRSNRNE